MTCDIHLDDKSGIIDGDVHWHKHDGEDEFFLVLDVTCPRSSPR